MHTYEVHTTDDEIITVTTDLDIEIWIEEYEAQYKKTVAEYDLIEKPDSVETEEWWAA